MLKTTNHNETVTIMILTLTDDPQSTTVCHRVFNLTNPQAINLIFKLNQRCHGDLIRLNQALTRSFQHIRPNYYPIEAHNYLPVLPHYTRQATNQLIGFNCVLYSYFDFYHQPIYLNILSS